MVSRYFNTIVGGITDPIPARIVIKSNPGLTFSMYAAAKNPIASGLMPKKVALAVANPITKIITAFLILPFILPRSFLFSTAEIVCRFIIGTAK